MDRSVFDYMAEYEIVLDNSDLAITTIKGNKTSLRQFRRWLQDNTDIPRDIGKIKPRHIEEFFFYRKSIGCGKGVRSQNYIHINKFFKWVKSRYKKALKKNPFDKVERINYKLPHTVFPERDLLDKIINNCDASFNGIRNRLAFTILKETGIRADELLSLQQNDLDIETQTLIVRDGKGGKSREIPFEEATTIALLNYLQIRKDHPNALNKALFLTVKGGMKYESLRLALRAQCEMLGMDVITPHKFRHAYADWLKEMGVTEEGQMELLGWDTRSMLDHYARSKRKQRAINEYQRKIRGSQETE